ncbi:MAG: hypothetical protein KJZ70_10910 [Bryobacterales bacterium]|nr:hypothetical protein [Bryobacterales bacterium]
MNTLDNNRFFVAILLYGALAASTFYTLNGKVRVVVLILLGGLTFKTWLAREREKLDASEDSERARSSEEP